MPIDRAKITEISQEKVLNLISELSSKLSGDNPSFHSSPILSEDGLIFPDGAQLLEAVASRTSIIHKTSDYTLSSLEERDALIEINSTSPVAITIPSDQILNFPIGTSLDILQTGSGQVTILSNAITLSDFGSGGLSGELVLSLTTENLNIEPGQLISGTGIATGTLVVGTNGTSITVDTPFTGQVSGQLLFKAGISATPGFNLRTKWSSATIFKRAKNSWLIFGDLSSEGNYIPSPPPTPPPPTPPPTPPPPTPPPPTPPPPGPAPPPPCYNTYTFAYYAECCNYVLKDCYGNQQSALVSVCSCSSPGTDSSGATIPGCSQKCPPPPPPPPPVTCSAGSVNYVGSACPGSNLRQTYTCSNGTSYGVCL